MSNKPARDELNTPEGHAALYVPGVGIAFVPIERANQLTQETRERSEAFRRYGRRSAVKP